MDGTQNNKSDHYIYSTLIYSNLSSTEATAEVLEQAAALNMKRKGDADMLEEWLGCECS